ncbi:hypothetical protein GOP47_0026069 [Adiantum capillus-veneris]|uniref:Uncharacterized protein n=1 Tax=Adiantum capillus-veneris TaxID=13818 RepID=A0A9D4U1M4_ADICA|nr:hypothetical protein GOP47_0026069 [Adiantum capillus-veneris]
MRSCFSSINSSSQPAPLQEREHEPVGQEFMEEKQFLTDTHTHNPTPPSPYSLTSGPHIICPRGAHAVGGSSMPATFSSSTCPSSPSSTPKEQDFNPLIGPSDHIKTLLSKLGSSISALKAFFALASPKSSLCTSASAMAAELQTLSHLHMQLSSLIQEHEFGMEKDSSNNESIFQGPHHVDAILKSYEGIISRFHDEIRKKDAVIEALKETLAKSMLKVEKLERRMKAAETHCVREQRK